MSMRTRLDLFLWVFSSSSICTSGFSRLAQRQGDFNDDSLAPYKIIESVVDGAETLGNQLGQAADGLKNMLFPPNPTLSVPVQSLSQATTIENSEPEATEPPTYSLSTTKSNCEANPDDASGDDCESRVDYIIRPLTDGPNQPIRDALTALKLRKPYSVSEDPKRGMFFCLAGLTIDEADRFRARRDVAFVARDEPAQSSDSTSDESEGDHGSWDHWTSSEDARSAHDEHLAEYRSATQKHLEKRVLIQAQRNAPRDLVSLSTPKGMAGLKDYFYPTQAGEGVTVYVIDGGFEPSNSEFIRQAANHRWLFAMGADKTQADDVAEDKGHGSCVASKVVGYRCGSAKKAKMVFVRTELRVSSILDGFQKVIQDLYERDNTWEQVRGRTVVSISRGWYAQRIMFRADARLLDDSALLKIETLLDDYQAVVVTSAGNDARRRPEITLTPAKFGRILPIIAVGGVTADGGRDPDSQGGPAMAVCAVSYVECASPVPGDALKLATGTSFAAPIVAGLVADLLSRKSEGDELRRTGISIPTAVRDYVIKLAYPRVAGGNPVAWNGVRPFRFT